MGIMAFSLARRSNAFSFKHLLLSTLCASSLALSLPALAQAQKGITYNIAQAPLAEALNTYGVQSGLKLTFGTAAVAGKMAPELKGSYEPQKALDILLRGSGLTYRTGENNTLIISEGPRPQSSAEPPPVQLALAASDVGEEITVTGTRIARSGYSAPVPLTVVGPEQIATSGYTNVDDVLRQTPSITAGIGAANATGNEDAGTAFVNLRGLGTNRSLTLVNGRRRVSGSRTSSAVDLNTIPTAMIERVEVITGGASAVYGADAVSGAVNVITKKDFDGLMISAQGGIGDKGDAEQYSISFFGGTTFAADRGHIDFSASYNKQAELLSKDRSYISPRPYPVVNPANTGPNDGIPDNITVRGYGSFSQQPDANFFIENGNKYYQYTSTGLSEIRADRVVRTGFLGSGVGGDLTDYTDFAQLRLPVKTLSFRSDVAYELSDGINFFAEGEFTQTNSTSLTDDYRIDERPTNFNGLGGPQIALDNPFLPPEVAALMTANGLARLPVRKRLVDELDQLENIHDRKTFTIVSGLEGKIADRWNWDVSYQYGQVTDDIQNTNLLVGPNFLNATDVISNPATGQPECRNAAARAAGCVPYNIFVRGPFSQAQRDYFVRTRLQYVRNTQEIISAHVSGDLFTLPAGAVSSAVGAEHRKEALTTRDDALSLSGALTWTGVAVPHKPVDAEFTADEAYAELLVPVLHDMPFIQALDVDAAVRVSDYSTIGSTLAWRSGINWTVADDIRFRVSRSRSVRAPNLFELYSPQEVGSGRPVDPCNDVRINTVGENRRTNCVALGAPAGGTTEYTGFAEIVSGGNPNLKEETSNSFTIGSVITPQALPDVRVSIDYWNIKITDAVSSFGAQTMLERCVDSSSLDNTFCRNIVHRPDSQAQRVNTAVINAAELSASGVDLALDYKFLLRNGDQLGFNVLGTYLINKESLVDASDPSTLVIQDGDYANPRVRINATVSYTAEKWNASIINRFISKSDLNRQGSPEAYDISTASARIYTDGRFDYDFNETLSGYIGINNILDIRPPYNYVTFGATLVNGNVALYDVIGRFVHGGVKFRF